MRHRAKVLAMTPHPVQKRMSVGDVTWLTGERVALAPLTCVELTRATFEQGVQSLRGLQEAALKRHELPPNVLVVMRSQHMPWRIREEFRKAITSTGAALFEVDADTDIAEAVEEAVHHGGIPVDRSLA